MRETIINTCQPIRHPWPSEWWIREEPGILNDVIIKWRKKKDPLSQSWRKTWRGFTTQTGLTTCTNSSGKESVDTFAICPHRWGATYYWPLVVAPLPPLPWNKSKLINAAPSTLQMKRRKNARHSITESWKCKNSWRAKQFVDEKIEARRAIVIL